ncbi:U3 small nucleolar RNA-associated protein 4 [Histomonas meleagridis]|uniref:U3 small nucleolar RNA-associated protein 4-like n=1 Tax=Histomonas meleagridis TaxID=135588 RepID=UPI0035598059|nr:U3 small nucleolar RNA-associated protein 4 [Histomonas meleagridis]KAH0801525.1 U3 small nucleolar RNA-associated protein 4-like [Histomonas meleagridis]
MTEIHRIRFFDYVPSPIVSISINEAHDTLAVGRSNGILELWNIKENSYCIASFEVAVSNDLKGITFCKFEGKDVIAVATLSGQLSIFDAERCVSLGYAGYGGSIFAIATNHSQNLIAVACGDQKVIRIFSTDNGLELIRTSEPLDSTVISVCFDNDDNIYSGNVTGKICKIDTKTGAIIAIFNVPNNSPNDHISIWAITPLSFNNNLFATGDSTGTLRIWDSLTATITDEFVSHQAPIYCIVSNKKILWASGVDPTVVQFSYNPRTKQWVQTSLSRNHTHDVVSLVFDGHNYVISASNDATFCVRRNLIYPHQKSPAVSSAIRSDDNEIIVAGGFGKTLTVWKLDGNEGKLELTLKTAEDGVQINTVAVSLDGKKISYSANNTRELIYNNDKWSFAENIYEAATVLRYSPTGVLYYGTIGGYIHREDGKSFNIGFPIFRISFSTKDNIICVGGLKRIFVLDNELNNIINVLPMFETPFSTFEFQPGYNRILVSNGGKKMLVINVKNNKVKPRKITKFGVKGYVSANGISFNRESPTKVLQYSSARALIRDYKGLEKGAYKLPYYDILYAEYLSNDKIVIFEKPWIFMMSDLPIQDVFRAKRFLSHNEDQLYRF